MKYQLKIRKMKIENGLPVFIGWIVGQSYDTLRKAQMVADAINSKKSETYFRASVEKI